MLHVWFARTPPVHWDNPAGPLPARHRPEQIYDTWIDASALAPGSVWYHDTMAGPEAGCREFGGLHDEGIGSPKGS
jgi:hypothetical protein